MIGCLRRRVRKQPIIALYFESETVLKFYNLKAWSGSKLFHTRIVFLKEFFEKVNFEKSQQMTKAWKITQHAKSLEQPPPSGY